MFRVLERAHCRQRTELMVECRHAHSCGRREFLHMKRLGVVGSEPGDRSRSSVAQIAFRCDGSQPLSLRSSEYAVEDFTLNQVAEEWYILGSLKKLEEPGAGAQQSDRRLTNSQALLLRRTFGLWQIIAAQDVPRFRHIKPETHLEQGQLCRGFDDLHLDV